MGKNNTFSPLVKKANCLDEPRDYHTETEKDKYYMVSFICGI